MPRAPIDGEQPREPPSREVRRREVSSGASDQRARLSFSRRQIVLAIVIAALSDLLCAFLVVAPPLVWTADLVTAFLLFAVLGWQWLLLPGLVLEAIPGLGVIPFWLLVVGAILVWGTARPKLK
jgi:hypothetical protein